MTGDRWSGPGVFGDVGAMVLDQAFSADTIRELRKVVREEAVAARMPDTQAALVTLAVHELASNAVLHGGGAGRVRMRVVAGELHCQVSDAGPGSVNGDADRGGTRPRKPWPIEPGRGLWLVRNVADRLSVQAARGGSEVTAVFALPRFGAAPLISKVGIPTWLPPWSGGDVHGRLSVGPGAES